MAKRRRSRSEESVEELNEVLEPYENELFYDQNAVYFQEESQEMYYEPYAEEYSEEHEAADFENRFRFAVGLMDLISILIGIVAILVLVAMLVTLFQWLKDDILHSALLMQSGLW